MANLLIIFSANYLYLFSVFIALVWFLKFKKNLKQVFSLIALAFFLSYITAKLSSFFIYDPRPFVVEHIKPLIPHIADNGFPSDHMRLTMAIASVIFVYNRRLGIILAIIAICVGTARVLAGVHHTEDILGSSVISIISTYVAFLFISHLSKRFRKTFKQLF